ncbi:GreA/GreB family elongation factor [Rasiella sp. SM2506]|uniref:GreA/GreB family elongation factor n=1 Tax=Rasiella sp. SM2506 TaxID=3423914 RepID=UPI003D7BF6F7
MSRGFVKEDDQEEKPIIPPRAALPAGVTNYVTTNGLKELNEELQFLDTTITTLTETDERERRVALSILNGKRNLLLERINSARLLDSIKSKEEVRFGAFVTYKIEPIPQAVTIQLVGVDEANVKKQKIAFVAPIAKALIGAREGDVIDFKLGNEQKKITIINITYKSH